MLTSVRIRSRSTASSGSLAAGSVHSWNFSTIQASSPDGESTSDCPMVCGRVPWTCMYAPERCCHSCMAASRPRSASVSAAMSAGSPDGKVTSALTWTPMTWSGAGAAHQRGDEGAHVPALHAVAVVAEPRHQLDQRGGGAAVRPAGLGQRPGEPVAGQRRDHQVEGVGRVAAVRGRVGERADHVEELHDRARPAVQQHQRRGARLGGAHVQEVHVGSVDRGDELGIGVERRLVGAPVVLRWPSRRRARAGRRWGRRAPSRCRAGRGPSGSGPAVRGGRRCRPAGR